VQLIRRHHRVDLDQSALTSQPGAVQAHEDSDQNLRGDAGGRRSSSSTTTPTPTLGPARSRTGVALEEVT
jgi:hypothetical protein